MINFVPLPTFREVKVVTVSRVVGPGVSRVGRSEAALVGPIILENGRPLWCRNVDSLDNSLSAFARAHVRFVADLVVSSTGGGRSGYFRAVPRLSLRRVVDSRDNSLPARAGAGGKFVAALDVTSTGGGLSVFPSCYCHGSRDPH